MNPQTIRIAVIAVVFALLYASRLTRGKPRQTPAGLEFALKPVVLASRVLLLILYAGFLAFVVHTGAQRSPAWTYLLFVVVIGVIVAQLPGTIVLGPDSVTQTYWFLGKRVIAYTEVVTLQAVAAGRGTRVLGDNRVTVTHTQNHSASEEFRTEMQTRTGKRLG